MANHLTPTELARESGLQRHEVLSKCVELGVPVFHGRIDKSLFLASLHGVPQAQRQAGSEIPPGNADSPSNAAPSAAF